jgi:hypothetical protein
MALETRIVAAYLALTGAPTPRGAKAWFARICRVQPYTVSRWIAGRRDRSRALAVLEQLEARANLSPDLDCV